VPAQQQAIPEKRSNSAQANLARIVLYQEIN
jgi:hypothetical protein